MISLETKEHDILPFDSLSEELKKKVACCKFLSNAGYMCAPKYLGLSWDFSGALRASYYIGATWLVKDEATVVVVPKMSNINFMEMFITALAVDTNSEANYFSKCYGIDFDAPKILVDKRLCQLTPLLLLHYITLLEKLVKQGLKKGYVNQEENLNSKIRGQIYVPAHIQKNICIQREDRTYCRFQEYTEDILENRLLKKALVFASRAISCYKSFGEYRKKLQNRLNSLMAAFANVSENVEVHQIPRVSHNKLFRNYSEAIKVAKMVLRHFDYSIKKAEESDDPAQYEASPFWIDMPSLFELYVYSKLNRKYDSLVKFQVQGNGGVCDFIKVASAKDDSRYIMDAKYKPYYTGESPIKWDDIQEISGYARDKKILDNIGWTNSAEVPPCIVIFPEYENDGDVVGATRDDLDLSHMAEVAGYTNFYKIAVKVPRL